GRENLEDWKLILRGLMERGLRRVMIVIHDDFTGLLPITRSLFPTADVQLCVVHMQRNAKTHLPVLPPSNVVKPHEAQHSQSRMMLPGRRTRARSRTMPERLSNKRSPAALAAFRLILPAWPASEVPVRISAPDVV